MWAKRCIGKTEDCVVSLARDTQHCCLIITIIMKSIKDIYERYGRTLLELPQHSNLSFCRSAQDNWMKESRIVSSAPMLPVNQKLKVFSAVVQVVALSTGLIYVGCLGQSFVSRVHSMEEEVGKLKLDLTSIKNEMTKNEKVKK